MYAVYKQIGETPLSCIDRLFDRSERPYTYAGRLDPLAEGLLVILTGNECKEAKAVHRLNKTYQFSFAIGLATDSYDCLGRITACADITNVTFDLIYRAVARLRGSHTLPYPPYSARAVDGKPLHQHARDGTLSSVTIPRRVMTVTDLEVAGIEMSTRSAIRGAATRSVRRVIGDFRQRAILSDWSAIKEGPVVLVHAKATVKTGTYIRSLVRLIGNDLNLPTVTTAIKRTALGSLRIADITQPPTALPLQCLQRRSC